MKYIKVSLLVILQCKNTCVFGSATKAKKIRGNDHQNRDLAVLQERKQVPANYALKASLKRSRVVTTFSVPTTVPSPTSTAKSQGEIPSQYSLAKTPGSPTPPSVFPPSPFPSETPSSHPSQFPTKKPTPFPIPHPTKVPTLKPVKVPTDKLTFVGDNGNPGHEFPLAMCEGDCDSGKTL